MRMFLCGQWQERPETISVTNPFDGTVVDSVPKGTASDVDTALRTLVSGAAIMRNMAAYDRSQILRRAANLMLARENDLGRTISTEEGKILAEGVNRVTSTNDPTAHAEVLAIRQACEKLGVFELKDCELYTSCEPCPMCLGAIYWARLRRIYFANTAQDAARIGFDDSFIYSQLKQSPSLRSIPTIQIMREEALAGFRAWTEKVDRIPY